MLQNRRGRIFLVIVEQSALLTMPPVRSVELENARRVVIEVKRNVWKRIVDIKGNV